MSFLSQMKEKYSGNVNRNQNFQRSVNYFNFKSGDNNVRLVGTPIVTRTYYLPKGQYSPIDLFNPNAFDYEANENAIPKVINCANWNIEREEWEDNGDVLFMLNKIAREMLRIGAETGIAAEELKRWELIRNKTNPTLQYRWFGFDRDNPFVMENINGRTVIKEPRELVGYKLMTFSKTMFEQICAVQEAYGDDDIFDVEKGCDIVIKKTDGKGSSVQLRMSGRSVVETPLTSEERNFEMPNLLEVCGKQIANEQVMNNLLPEYVDMINDPSFAEIIKNTTNENQNKKSNKKVVREEPKVSYNDVMDIEDEDNIPF